VSCLAFSPVKPHGSHGVPISSLLLPVVCVALASFLVNAGAIGQDSLRTGVVAVIRSDEAD
jgi:hypothetical protein